MTKEDLKNLYPGDILKVSIPGFLELPEARIVRFEDYDKDGNPDALYVIGKQISKVTDSFIVVKPERCEFIRHDDKIQVLIDKQTPEKDYKDLKEDLKEYKDFADKYWDAIVAVHKIVGEFID